MTESEIQKLSKELQATYPQCHIKIAPDKQEMVVEISDGFAVAVIERSQAHFHLHMTEVYRVLRGGLYVACAGGGHVLREGDSLTIKPQQVHFARAAGEPAWIEVRSSPSWTADDHFVL